MTRRTRIKDRNGIALVVVFVMVMLITLAAYRFSFVMQSEYRMARLYEEQVDARHAAWSGIEHASSLVDMPPASRPVLVLTADTRSTAIDNPFIGDLIRSNENQTAAIEPDSGWKFALIAPSRATIASAPTDRGLGTEPLSATDTVWRWGLENESAKIPIRALMEWEKAKPGYAKSVLSRLPGIKPEIIEPWLAQAGVLSPRGRFGGQGRSTPSAWSSTTMSNSADGEFQPTSSSSANTNVDMQTDSTSDNSPSAPTIARQWDGGDLNQNYRNDSLEKVWLEKQLLNGASNRVLSSATQQEEAVALQRYITRFSGCRNERHDGSPRIYVNDSDLRALHRRLLSDWPQPLADYVILARQHGPSNASRQRRRGRSSSDASTVADSTTASRESTSTEIDWGTPGRYQIRSLLELVDSALTIPAPSNTQSPQNKSVVSPFSSRSAEGSNYLIRLLDDCTTDRRTFLESRIDVWDAPFEVLMALPDMDEGTANRIISTRQDETIRQQSSGTLAWLLQRRIIDLPTLRKWEPYLTARSDVYTTQAFGFRDQNTSIYRCTVTIDGSHTPSRPRELKIWHTWDAGFNLNEFVGEKE